MFGGGSFLFYIKQHLKPKNLLNYMVLDLY